MATPSLRRATLALALLASGALAPRTALATPSFPEVVQRELALSSAPPCGLCHGGGTGTRGDVNTPFGRAARERGLAPFDEASLSRALAALGASRNDADGDGVGDLDELRGGTDPNVSPSGGGVEVPRYGCGARVAATPPPRSWAPCVAVVAVAAACLRRRRARR